MSHFDITNRFDAFARAPERRPAKRVTSVLFLTCGATAGR